MKKTINIILIIIVFTASIIQGKLSDGNEFFPKMEGFLFDGKKEIYLPETLFEYINGGADLFLNFDFVTLYSRKYKNISGGEITADIYIHSDLPNGLGIYSQEKPDKGNFINIGTEGYYEDGILNFFKGPIYVKLSGFDLGDKRESILKDLAFNISKRIKYKKGYPKIFSKFPSENKIYRTDKYVNIGFLGHSFLNKVYSRKYSIHGKILELFVIVSDIHSEVEAVQFKYSNYIRSKGISVEKNGNIVRFTDPYYKNRGTMNLFLSKNVLIGMFCDDIKLFQRMVGFTPWVTAGF